MLLICLLYVNTHSNFLQPTLILVAPPIVSFLATSEDVKPQHLESIRTIFVGAAPFGEALAQKFLRKAPHVTFREGNRNIRI